MKAYCNRVPAPQIRVNKKFSRMTYSVVTVVLGQAAEVNAGARCVSRASELIARESIGPS